MFSTVKDTWEWINPTTFVKEKLGKTIGFESNTTSRGTFVKYTFIFNGMLTKIEGYQGIGMDCSKGIGSLKLVK